MRKISVYAEDCLRIEISDATDPELQKGIPTRKSYQFDFGARYQYFPGKSMTFLHEVKTANTYRALNVPKFFWEEAGVKEGDRFDWYKTTRNTIKKKLSKRRWKYIKMRYGFENEQPHSNAEISKELNLSRQAVSIGMHRAFEEIKEPSNMILLFPEYEKHVKALEEVADYKKEREQYEVLTQKKLRETTSLNDDAKNLIEMLLKGISVEQIKCYLENHTSLGTDTLLTQSLRCIPEFQLRTYNILMRNGINTMGKLCQHSFKSLAKIKGMGPTTLNDVLYVLKLYGISLKS